MPKPKYSILNDFDDDVTNLYQVLLYQKEELLLQAGCVFTHVPLFVSVFVSKITQQLLVG